MTSDENQPATSPRTMELSYFLHMFIKLRWGAAASTAAVLACCQLILGFDLPYMALYGVVIGICVYNIALTFFVEQDRGFSPEAEFTRARHRRALVVALTQTTLDQIALFLLLHFSGGLENPFVLLFLLHVVIAGLLYEAFAVALAAFNVALAVFALGVTEKLGWLHHYHVRELLGDVEAVSNWLFVLGLPAALTLVVMVLSAFMVVIMNERSRRRDQIITLAKDRARQNAKLMRVDKLRRGLLAVATHDLKAPLAAVSSYLQTLAAGYAGPINEKQGEILERCKARVDGLSRFIADILSLTAVERGEIRENLRFADLAPLLTHVVDDYLVRATEKNQQLRLVIADDLPKVLLAPDRMAQLLENLVSNAIKYTPKGKEIEIKAESTQEWLVLSVKDQGIGISAEDQAKLFADFFRSSAVKKDYEGTGLGLSMVRRIVQAHAGEIEVHSEPGQGSTFTVRLPRDSRAYRRDSVLSILPGFSGE
ncbi:MAG: HAMP domain-containing histidine kinase [Myxococcota bacterium]|jgi:signal transduction histidine kinase|nr:HAMP domain-containing histidine kinase [Myxococcota bacterium]